MLFQQKKRERFVWTRCNCPQPLTAVESRVLRGFPLFKRCEWLVVKSIATWANGRHSTDPSHPNILFME